MSVIYPLAAMVLLTLLVSVFLLLARIRSVNAGAVSMSYYEVCSGARPPVYVLKTTRHWANLFEAPVLFYVVCLAALALDQGQGLFLYLAWGYVGARLLHTLVHLTYNRVMHRLGLFLLSQAVLIGLWVVLLLRLPQA